MAGATVTMPGLTRLDPMKTVNRKSYTTLGTRPLRCQLESVAGIEILQQLFLQTIVTPRMEFSASQNFMKVCDELRLMTLSARQLRGIFHPP